MTNELSKLLSNQQKYDDIYDATESIRDDVDALMKAEKWEEATRLWMQIDTNMLEISEHQSKVIIALLRGGAK